jgi:hypothetical protein
MRKIFFVPLSMLVALAASAAQLRDFYVIPVAAHASGANGTSWRTDVSIQNIQAVPVTIEISVVESGEGLLDNVFPVSLNGASSVTVPAGGSLTLGDVLKNHRGRAETSGALLVGGDKVFALTSRTYNVTTNGTMGQTVSPSGDVGADGNSSVSTLYIPGLASNSSFRTNLGLLMSAATPLTVTVTINGADGRALGTRTFNVGAGITTQVQFAATTVAAAPFDAAGAIVRITSGSGTVVAYASEVDNVTGDASFISGGGAAAGSVPPLSALLAAARQ